MNSAVPVAFSLVVATWTSLVPRSAQAADAAFFGIIKSQQYLQTNTAPPVALNPGGFAFNSFVFATASGAVTNATVDPPGSTTPVRELLPDDTQTVLRYEERFDSQGALDTAFPNGGLTGNYLMTLRTVNDGLRTATLNFTIFGLPIGAPPVLQISTLPAAQSIDHSRGFTLRWSGSGGQALDLVQLVILDAASNSVYASPLPLSPGALTGTSNHVVLPPYTLPAGSALTGHLSIARPGLPNTNAYPGAIGLPAILRDTEFPLQTRPAPVEPYLEIRPASPDPGAGPITLRFTVESNRLYRLQTAEDFGRWTDLLVTNPPPGTVEYIDPTSPGLPRRIYRVRIGD